jgi:hypothetical protein
MVAKKMVKKVPPVAEGKPARKKSAKQAAGMTARERNKAAWSPEQKELASRPVDRSRGGVPTHFTPEEKERLIPLILDKLEEGKSLWTAVREIEGAPSAVNFQRWVRDDDKLTQLYAASRLRGYLMFAEDLQEIADNPHEGITTVITRNDDGVEERITKEDMLGHRQLQIATRKWLLAKMMPKVFGDRISVDTTDPKALQDIFQHLANKLPG